MRILNELLCNVRGKKSGDGWEEMPLVIINHLQLSEMYRQPTHTNKILHFRLVKGRQLLVGNNIKVGICLVKNIFFVNNKMFVPHWETINQIKYIFSIKIFSPNSFIR